jgi:hypothetical protein
MSEIKEVLAALEKKTEECVMLKMKVERLTLGRMDAKLKMEAAIEEAVAAAVAKVRSELAEREARVEAMEAENARLRAKEEKRLAAQAECMRKHRERVTGQAERIWFKCRRCSSRVPSAEFADSDVENKKCASCRFLGDE